MGTPRFPDALVGAQRGLVFDAELLYVGAMFHDIGLIEGHRSEAERFEIDGANAARAFLEQHGVPSDEVMTVWEAIALHTTPEIRYDAVAPEVREAVVVAHPRTGFKEGIVDAFADGMRFKPDTTFGTMNVDILEAKVAGYVRPNFCDFIANSPFSE